MSFGVSIGDFITIVDKARRLHKRCKAAPEDYAALAHHVVVLQTVLDDTRSFLEEGEVPASPSRLTSILTARDGCQTTLDEVEGLLDRYPSFSVNRKRRIELLKFITRDVEALKVKLSNNTQLLQISLASLTMLSVSRVEQALNIILKEYRTGLREPTVVSSAILDGENKDEDDLLEQLSADLEDKEIPPEAISLNKPYILSWLAQVKTEGGMDEWISRHSSPSPNSPNDCVHSSKTTCTLCSGNQSSLAAVLKPDENQSLSESSRSQALIPADRQHLQPYEQDKPDHLSRLDGDTQSVITATEDHSKRSDNNLAATMRNAGHGVTLCLLTEAEAAAERKARHSSRYSGDDGSRHMVPSVDSDGSESAHIPSPPTILAAVDTSSRTETNRAENHKRRRRAERARIAALKNSRMTFDNSSNSYSPQSGSVETEERETQERPTAKTNDEDVVQNKCTNEHTSKTLLQRLGIEQFTRLIGMGNKDQSGPKTVTVDEKYDHECSSECYSECYYGCRGSAARTVKKRKMRLLLSLPSLPSMFALSRRRRTREHFVTRYHRSPRREEVSRARSNSRNSDYYEEVYVTRSPRRDSRHFGWRPQRSRSSSIYTTSRRPIRASKFRKVFTHWCCCGSSHKYDLIEEAPRRVRGPRNSRSSLR